MGPKEIDTASRRDPVIQVAVGGLDSVQVVVQKTARRRLALGRRVCGGENAGVLADQVMKPVTSRSGFGQ